MSYIITSNKDFEDRPETSNIFKPYSYTNRLSDTIKIEKDSEVAVESVKINKNGLYSLNNFNSKLALYFGKNVSDKVDSDNVVGSDNIQEIQSGTSMPVATSLVETNNFEELAPIQVAEKVFSAYGRMLMNPLYLESTLITDPPTPVPHLENKCEVNYDADGHFQGYKFTLKQKTAISDQLPEFTNETPNKDGLISEFETANFDWENAGAVFECTDPLSTTGACALLADKPVALNCDPDNPPTELSFEVDFTGAEDSKSRWCIGLCRKNNFNFNADGSIKAKAPPYYDINAGKMGQNKGWGYSKQFFDYVVCRQGDDLRVFQSCVKTDRNTRVNGRHGSNLVMREVIYYHSGNPTFKSGLYNIDSNPSGYDSVAFRVCGEIVSAYMVKGGSYTPLVDFTTMPTAPRNSQFTPVSDLQRVLYGKVYLKKNSDTLEITKRFTYPHLELAGVNLWDCENPFSQLSTQLIHTGQYDRWGKLLENRSWNDFSATAPTTVYPYMSVNSDGGIEGFNMVLITAQADQYLPEYTQQLSAARLLGFDGRFVFNEPTVDPAKPDQVQFVWNSIKRPSLVSPKSLFIRLNNFTHNTAVGSKGNAYSKILMHLPRFDNSGAEIGALYFEPYERLYVALNNPEELNINEFELDIVYDNEQFAECLVGKTIICLHIRPRGTKLLDTERKEIKQIVIRD